MAVALINGNNFTHKQIVFNVGGVPVVSLSSLDITDPQMKEFSFGTGGLPVGIGIGREEQKDLTFEISMTDFKALTQATDANDIKALDPFDIPVTLLNPSNGWGFTVKNVCITEISPSSDTDTTDIKVGITAIASHIVWK